MSSDDAPPNIDELVAELRARVDARRAAGDYPPGFEDELAEHFRRIVAHRSHQGYEELHEALADVAIASEFGSDRIPVTSDVPGGPALHKAISKIVSRQTNGVLEQMSEFAASVRAALGVIVQAIEDPAQHNHAHLVGQIDMIEDRLAAYERTPGVPGIALRDLRRRVEDLEAAEASRGFRPWFSNDSFEDAFRGSRDELVGRYRDLAQRLVGCSPVLDIGCGRGEFLGLLREVGVEAVGVELDGALVKTAVEDGYAVDEGDGLEYLMSLADGSLGGIALIQVIEHLTAQQALDLVALAAAKVRPGGKVVIETVNPQSLYVYAHSFYLDPTHVRPVHPSYLRFLFAEAGFREAAIDWRSPVPSDDVLDDVQDEAWKANVARLNQLLFAPQDYAVIATR